MSFISPPIFASAEFDGTWSARAYTNSGNCKRQYSFKLNIVEGKLTGTVRGNAGNYTLEGIVNDDGVTEFGMIGPEEGTFTGKIIGNKAKGKWESRSCRGSFKLKKKS